MREVLKRLYRGEVLGRDETAATLAQLLDGELRMEQAAAWLSALNMRVPALGELLGLRDELLRRAVRPEVDVHGAIDMVGTGGDGLDTFNVTTLSALTVAACGQRVVKHGNASATSKHGSSDALRAVGYAFPSTADQIQQHLNRAGVVFLHAPQFHPALGRVAELRKGLGVPTIFNLLGPLVNPLRPPINFMGVADARVQGLYDEVLAAHSEAHLVVHSTDGYDEATLTGPVRCYGSTGRATLQPPDFGLRPTLRSDIVVDADFRAQFERVLEGRGRQAETDTVSCNAGLALAVARRLPLRGTALRDCVREAKDCLLSGQVASNFRQIIAG